MGKWFVALLLIGGAIFGARAHSEYKLLGRVHDYRAQLRSRALATRRGSTTPPTEEEVETSAEEIARELGLTLTEVDVTVREDADPSGAGAIAADKIGELPGQVNVDSDGTINRGPDLTLRTTLVEVHAHVRAKGFLCVVEQEVSDFVNFGYAMK